VQASDRCPSTLLAAFSAVWLFLTVDPPYRQDWLQAQGHAGGGDAPTGRKHYDRLVHFSHGLRGRDRHDPFPPQLRDRSRFPATWSIQTRTEGDPRPQPGQ
jgi:hypothetical protein